MLVHVGQLKTLVTQYYAINGPVAERTDPKLTREDLDNMVANVLPSVDGRPNARALRLTIESASTAALGTRLALEGKTIDVALAGMDAAVRVRNEGALRFSVRHAQPSDLDAAVNEGRIRPDAASDLVRGAYRDLLLDLKFDDAMTFAERFAGYFVPTTAVTQTAIDAALATKDLAWVEVDTLETLLDHGYINRQQLIAALAKGYLFNLGHVPGGGAAQGIASRAKALNTYAPYLAELPRLSDAQRDAAEQRAIRSVADWTNSHNVADVETRLGFIREHRSPGDEPAVIEVLAAGARKFLDYGAVDAYDAIIGAVSSVLTSHAARDAALAAIGDAQEASKHDLLDRVVDDSGQSLAFGFERLALLGAVGAIENPAAAEALVLMAERRLYECRGDSTERVRVIESAKRCATSLGVVWDEVFPRETRVFVEGADIGPKMRGADLDVDAPAVANLIALFLAELPPRTDAAHVLQRLPTFLDRLDKVRSGVGVDDYGRQDPLYGFGGTPDLLADIYAGALAKAVGASLGKTVTVAREPSYYASQPPRWVARFDGTQTPAFNA